MKKILILILILSLSANFTGCIFPTGIIRNFGSNLSNNISDQLDDNVKAEKKESQNIDTQNSDSLKLSDGIGDINVGMTDSDKITIDFHIKVSAETESRASEILNNFTYVAEEKNGTIVIGEKKDNIKLKKSGEMVSVDCDIRIPQNINSLDIDVDLGDININNVSGTFNIHSAVGDISLTNCSGSYDISSDVGDIDIKDCNFENKSDLSSSVGSININALSIEKASDINVQTDTGSIDMYLPKDADYEASISSSLKDTYTTRNRDGKTKIELSAEIGEVSLK